MRCRLSSRVVAWALLLGPACGSSNPTQPVPLPSPSAVGRTPGGELTGPYRLTLRPSAGCAMGLASVTVEMEAAPAGTTPHPGVQVVYTGPAPNDPSALELELLHSGNRARGGFGTRADGAPTVEGPQVWVRAVGGGDVSRLAGRAGEIVEGTLAGWIALGTAGAEGSLGSCDARDHAFALEVR